MKFLGLSSVSFFAACLLSCSNEVAVEIPTFTDAECRALLAPPCASVEITPEIVTACQNLYQRRNAFADRCMGVYALTSAIDEKVFVDACIGIMTAKGVTLASSDVDACAKTMDDSPCLGGGVYPRCIGYQGDFLYRDHDKKGSLPVGGLCFANVQCDSAYCEHLYGAPCGMCKRPRALGATCSDVLDVCAEGGCREGTCQLPGQRVGEDCTGKAVQCQETLHCNGTTCALPGTLGDACDTQHPCERGSTCYMGTCTARLKDGSTCSESTPSCSSGYCIGGVCSPRPAGLTEGQDCSFGFCRADLWCDDTKKCVSPTYLTEGAACLGSSPPTEKWCRPDLYCSLDCTEGICQDAGTCQAPPQAGNPCGYVAKCAKGAYCKDFDFADLSKSSCVALGQPGDPCPCNFGLACVANTCLAYGICGE